MPFQNSKQGNGELKRMAERAKKWIASPEGIEKLKKAVRLSREHDEQLRKDSRIDPKSLREPFTI